MRAFDATFANWRDGTPTLARASGYTEDLAECRRRRTSGAAVRQPVLEESKKFEAVIVGLANVASLCHEARSVRMFNAQRRYSTLKGNKLKRPLQKIARTQNDLIVCRFSCPKHWIALGLKDCSTVSHYYRLVKSANIAHMSTTRYSTLVIRHKIKDRSYLLHLSLLSSCAH